MAQSSADIKKIIYASLAQQTLGRALAQLSLLTKGTTNETLEDIKSNYQRLLKHWAEKVADPERETIFLHLLRQTYELTDDLLATRSVKPIATNALFAKYWEPKRYSASLVEEAMHLNEQGDMYQTAWVVSAITLSCIELFDENKLRILFEFCQNQHIQTSMRALTGIIICLILYKDRYPLYPAINNRLQILLDDDQMVQNAQNIVKQLIRSKETERITQDIQQNVLPTITKLAPKIHRDILSSDSFDTDDFEDASNSWQDTLEESGIQDKMETYAQMGREGSDINLSTFAQMKAYPFFNDFENWLLPFDAEHDSVKDLFATMPNPSIGSETDMDVTDNSLSKLLSLTNFLCDSDKYSFCFNLQMIPSDYRKSMVEQIKMGDEQISDIQKPSSELISNLYLQDLYRFYTLYAGKAFFTNPFKLDVNVHETAFFRFLNPEGDFLKQLADFFFAKEQYDNALTAYLKYTDSHKTSDLLYRKLGYCYQKLEEYAKAIDCYQKAELIATKNPWTLRKLAYCHRMLKQYQEALSYYLQAEEQAKDDLNIIYNIGSCYAELGQYQKALNAFYKIEFLQSDMSKSIYYHLYMGHCLWATGDTKAALEHYALFPHDGLAEQLNKACISLSERDKVYIVDYLRYH